MSPVRRRPAPARLLASAALILASLLAGCRAGLEPGTALHSPAACDWTATGESAANNFGYAVGSAGDVDGDGYADVIVGGDRYKQFTGRVYVYAGGPAGLSAMDEWTVALPDDTPPGTCEVFTGLYDSATLERLPVSTDAGQPVQDSAIRLGSVACGG